MVKKVCTIQYFNSNKQGDEESDANICKYQVNHVNPICITLTQQMMNLVDL